MSWTVSEFSHYILNKSLNKTTVEVLVILLKKKDFIKKQKCINSGDKLVLTLRYWECTLDAFSHLQGKWF